MQTYFLNCDRFVDSRRKRREIFPIPRIFTPKRNYAIVFVNAFARVGLGMIRSKCGEVKEKNSRSRWR